MKSELLPKLGPRYTYIFPEYNQQNLSLTLPKWINYSAALRQKHDAGVIIAIEELPMKNWLKMIGLTGLTAALGSTPGLTQATSLADALVQAYTTNPQLKVQQAAIRAADEAVITERSDLLPSLSQTGSLSRNIDLGRTIDSVNNAEVTNLGVQTRLTQQIYDGGADRDDIESARMSMEAQKQIFRNAEQAILLGTVQSYLNVRRDQELVKLAQNNVKVLHEQIRATQARFEVGEVTRTDVSQARARLAGAVSALEANKGVLEQSIDSYIAVVGIPPRNLRRPPPAPNIPDTAAKAEAVAIKFHPRMVEARFRVKVAEYNMASVNKNRRPVLTGTVTHTFSGDAGRGNFNTNSLNIALNGTVNLYQGGRLNSVRRQALAILEQSQSSVQVQGYVTRQAVNNAYTVLRVARASMVSNREQIRAAQVAFEGVREEARLGARTVLEVLDAEQEVLFARSSLISAVRDEYVGVYTILSEMGLLTAQHLKLGVPIYNPDTNYERPTKIQKNPLGAKRLNIFNKIKNRSGN